MTLRKYADRIQARAVRRCGELLKQTPPARGHENGSAPTRSGKAKEAGLSEHQRKTALRVASVSSADFEEQVESDAPPTVSNLAEQGKKTLLDLGTSSPHDFALATQAIATLRRFAEFCDEHDAAEVAAGVRPSEVVRVRAHVSTIDSWLDQFITRIGD